MEVKCNGTTASWGKYNVVKTHTTYEVVYHSKIHCSKLNTMHPKVTRGREGRRR